MKYTFDAFSLDSKDSFFVFLGMGLFLISNFISNMWMITVAIAVMIFGFVKICVSFEVNENAINVKGTFGKCFQIPLSDIRDINKGDRNFEINMKDGRKYSYYTFGGAIIISGGCKNFFEKLKEKNVNIH